MIQEIQSKSGVVIDVDQSTQDTGQCTVILHGEQEGKKKAHGMIVAEIMKVATQPNSGMDCSSIGTAIQIPIDVSYVGWVKGPKGKVVQDVSNRSNTRVDIDQQMVPGTAVIKVFGTREGVAHAKELLAFEISKVSPDTAAQINGTSVAQLASGIMPPGSEQLAAGGAPLQGQAQRLLPHEQDTPSQFSNIIIPASYVGWLKGRQGAMIRDIEGKSGAQINIDQETKELGHCTVNIMGGEEEKKKAYGLVVGEVMKVADQHGATGDVASLGLKEVIQIDASFIGWVKGPRGKVVQDISRRSNTRVDVEQPGNNPTLAFVKVYGTHEGVSQAKELIAFEIAKVSPETATAITGQTYDNVTPHHAMAPSAPSASSSGHAALGGFSGPAGAIVIPATYVGWVKGRSGAMVRDIEARSGASIDVDQSTIDMGHCTVNINGPNEQAKKIAHGFVVAEVVKAAEQSGDTNSVAHYGQRLDIRIESKYVGWVKGPRGKVVQDITARSATRVDVDQGNHMDPGYATVKVYGTFEGVQTAKELVAHEISKVSPEAASEIMGGAPLNPNAANMGFRGGGGGFGGGGGAGNLANLLANAMGQQQQPQANMNQLVQQLGSILGQGGFM
jgi:rRNA processing protein Krr1/Pno1